jgi:tetratricopeptide (TPR) repeat protein
MDSTSKLSEVRDRALLANALIDLGDVAPARQQLAIATRLCVTRPLPPQALYWVGKSQLRLGALASGRLLLDSARARTRPTDTDQQAASTALEAEYEVALGRASEGVRLADRALILEANLADYADTRAFALERSGALAAARDAYVALGNRHLGAIEIEGQQRARLAPLSVARLDEQLGQVDEARRTLGTFLERWPNADAALPMMQSARMGTHAASRVETRPAPTSRQ